MLVNQKPWNAKHRTLEKIFGQKNKFPPQKTLNPICPVKTRIPAQACVMVESMLGRIYAHVIRQGDPPRGAGPRLLHLLHHVVPGLVPVGELLPAAKESLHAPLRDRAGRL